MVIATVVHNFGVSSMIDRHNEQMRHSKRGALLFDIQPIGSVAFGKQFQKISVRISRAKLLIGKAELGPAVPVAPFITSASVAELPDGSCARMGMTT
jgi:hypothetical protein